MVLLSVQIGRRPAPSNYHSMNHPWLTQRHGLSIPLSRGLAQSQQPLSGRAGGGGGSNERETVRPCGRLSRTRRVDLSIDVTVAVTSKRLAPRPCPAGC